MPVARVLLTKITPPRPVARTLVRPRLQAILLEAIRYRVTLLHSGAGYGKSTAIATLAGQLAENGHPVIWYLVSEEDSDPLVFLLHLCHATQQVMDDGQTLSGLPLPLLESWDGSRGPLRAAEVLDQYINALSSLPAPALLVLDDVHTAAESPEVAALLDRLIALAPANLHVLLAARPPFKLPNLSRWRAQGDLLTIDQSVLAFTAAEIAALFAEQYHYELAPEETDLLHTATEGWAIALQLIWQSLRSGACVSVEDALAHQTSSLDSLFDILAREVFGGQPADVQDFLRVSATLREMTPEVCDALREQPDSAAMLAYLRRQELFVVGSGDGALRYHHIFHNFLREQASIEQRQAWHLRAAAYYRSCQATDAAIYHLLQAADVEEAAHLLNEYGAHLLASGRLDTLAAHLDSLPPETLHRQPALLSYLGDLARLHSRFQEALGWYQQAESLWRERGQAEGVGRALRGQARIYLDTVNPSRAEELLQQALRLSDGTEARESQARLYELLAENKLNAGRMAEAERLRQQAETLRAAGPSDEGLLFRVLLRTGRLTEARQMLEARAEAERREPVYTPRAHRETMLVLSLVYAFLGRAAEAYQAALDGTRRGIDLQSPFITAVGHMRQGHALLLIDGPDRYARARQQFEKTVEISRAIGVPRLRVEACWGLCLTYGMQGDLAQAALVAQEGIEIATQAGDEWVASLVRLAMGAGLTLSARYEAAESWLNRAAQGMLECADPLGRSAAQLWTCLALHGQRASARLAQVLPEVLAACRENSYDFLFTRRTLLGHPEPRALVPLLILARSQGREAGYAARLLDDLGLPDIEFHAGYQLRVTTLGSFQTCRGDQAIPANSWRREKARQLFQVLITFRSAPLDRDQIIEHLWPHLPPAAAQRNFKVTLNTLYQVLEPERDPGRESSFIVREGSTYCLRPTADLWVDADAFTHALQKAEALQADAFLKHDPANELALADQLKEALDLYQGEYLPDARYETWAAAEREHLAVLYLNAADRLSALYLKQGRHEAVLAICQRILFHDNCWERAYRHLMQAYAALGDRGQIARTYQSCLQTLRGELDVSPDPETEALYVRLVGEERPKNQ